MINIGLLIGIIIVVVLIVGLIYYEIAERSRAPPAVGTFICASSLAGDGAYGILARDPTTLDIECNTSDGKNCYWYSTLGLCSNALPTLGSASMPSNPLISGTPAYASAWPLPDPGNAMTTPTHWSYKARTDL
jgi:hypothetical protein